MMKNLLLLIALVGQMTFAQSINVTSVQILNGTEEGGFYYPVFSPKGTYLLTTNVSYVGLNLHTLATGEMKTLTTAPGAGYDVRISDDESNILFKQTEMRNNLRYTSLHKCDLDGKQTQVSAAVREKITPVFSGNQAAFVKGNALVKSQLRSSDVKSIRPFINIEDRKMTLYSGSTRKVLTPNGEDKSYFWASVSPDGKHIVYTVAAYGTFVCNIDGTGAVSLGKLNAPVWINNLWVAGMNDLDDGDRIISSEIVAVSISGQLRQTLTTPQTKIAMYPSASADGTKIAFNSGEGRIYIMNIQIK